MDGNNMQKCIKHTVCDVNEEGKILSAMNIECQCQFVYYNTKYRGLFSVKLCYKWWLHSHLLERHSEPKTNKTWGFPFVSEDTEGKRLGLLRTIIVLLDDVNLMM
jgi:hypothetical protein